MKIILKLVALPFALFFTIAAFICAFILSASEKVFAVASGLVFLCAVILLIIGETTGGVAFIAVAFLVSPFGIHAVAGGLAKLLGGAGNSLKTFILS